MTGTHGTVADQKRYGLTDRLRGNLFFKIFVAFWLASLMILISWMLFTTYVDDRPQRPAARAERAKAGHVPGPPHRYMLRMMYNLQHHERERLATAIERARKRHDLEIFLLDEQGVDVFARSVPPEALKVAEKLQDRRPQAYGKSAIGQISAHRIYRDDDGPMRAVFIFHPRALTWLDLLGSNPGLRIALAVLISGLMCYALSRLLTSRLEELRQASRKLATGELSTRLQVREYGGDETDDLARDFNSMAEQLQQRIQAQKQLLSDVSHELRSPLARLRVALALAQEASGDSTQLRRIETETERLESLIAQLLQTQIHTGDLETHIDLVALLRQLCDDATFEGQPQGKKVQLQCQLQEATIASAADLLRKSFDNVLRNALAYTPDHTTVNVALTRTETAYYIAVEDRGPGVPETDLPRLFDAFFRVDTARSRAVHSRNPADGYGLGLAIARRAIEQHGGHISAHNTSSGLRIEIELPIQST